MAWPGCGVHLLQPEQVDDLTFLELVLVHLYKIAVYKAACKYE